MPEYRSLSLEDRALFHSYAGQTRTMDANFACIYAWGHLYEPQIAEYGGFLLRKSMWNGKARHMFPMGQGDLAAVLDVLEREENQPLRINLLTQPQRERLEEACPGRFTYEEVRDVADYLYLQSDLAQLPGRKYHAKRNFISRFERVYAGRWTYEPLTEEMLPQVWAFSEQWRRKNQNGDEEGLREESLTIRRLLDNRQPLALLGGVLRVDGNIAAFTAGSRTAQDTMEVHIEKADYDIVGAYPMINREFVRNQCADMTYINREDDTGAQGLRKAKLSYHPYEVCMRYIATECTI